MEAKPSKLLDGAAPNLKREWEVEAKPSKSLEAKPSKSLDVKADGHNIIDKMGGGKVGIDFKQDPNIDLDDYIESGYGKLDVNYAHKLFLRGMTALGITESHIIEIYRSSGRLMQRRLDLFKKQADITKGAKGDANVRYAWLACSKEELSIVMKYGVGHYELSSSKCKYGFGVHLAAVTYPYLCSLYCDVDEKEIKHLVLCRVIMGNMELLRPGSDQLRPSGCEYDNGVDDIQFPKYYVVWEMNMNTHIYPEFVVSFKAPLAVEGNVCSNVSKKNGSVHSIVDTAKATTVPATTIRAPSSPWLRFSILLSSLRKMVPSHIMYLVDAHYALFMSKKISRDDFVSNLRLIVGDNVLTSAMHDIRFKRQSLGGSNGENIKQK